MCKRKLVLATTIGSFLEFYDFTVYNFFAIEIGKAVFSHQTAFVSTLLSFAIFAIGYIMRPLGGIIYGIKADKYGRTKSLYHTLFMMALATLIICLVPSSSCIGIFSPLLLLAARLLQGFAAGAESTVAPVLLLESGENRGALLSCQFVAQGLSGSLGAGLAAILHNSLTSEQLISWGWRVPFVIALLLLPIALLLRTYSLKHSKTEQPYVKTPTMLQNYKKLLLLDILTIFPTSVAIYTMAFYMPHFLIKLGHLSTKSFSLNTYSHIIMALGALLGGLIADKFKNLKHLVLPLLLAIDVLAIFSFLALNNGNDHLFSTTYLATMLAIGILMTPSALLVLQAFPRAVRGRANGIGYSIGVALFGGTTNVLLTSLQHYYNSIYTPLFYVSFALATGIIIFAIFPNQGTK